jgi:two-component system nitrate/nitrite response regulator NarL
MVRVIVVDDHPLFRRLLRNALVAGGDVDVVAEGEDGSSALSLVARFRPDVVVLDVRMPGLDGITAARLIAAHHPEISILLCSNDARADLPAELPAPFLPKAELTTEAVRAAAGRARR